MSNTRHAQPGSGFRQERYASSAALDRGLLANLVAARCGVLDSAEDRELIWLLQSLSWSNGGLDKVAEDLVKFYPESLGTAAMHRFGIKPGKPYDAEQAKAIRGEICNATPEAFLLKGELTREEKNQKHSWESGSYARSEDPDESPEIAALRKEAAARPTSYPVQAFLEHCRAAAFERSQETGEYSHDSLPQFLRRLCLDPELRFDDCWYLSDLRDPLRKYRAKLIAERTAGRAVTELGRIVNDCLDYTLEARCMSLLDGQARTGKTYAVKAWCDAHPGRARYIQVPSTNDDIGFFRAIAAGLGVSVCLKSKAQELRQRIEEAAQSGALALIFDEAHYLWPQSSYRDALPGRITWIMTALVNHNVPVALVTTPQFLRSQRAVEQRGGWTSEQFIGRIGHYEKLPDTLPDDDLRAVAKSLWPEGDAGSLAALVNYAKVSAKYLAGIDAVVKRARFLASRDTRSAPSQADIKRALKESAIPSDSALTLAIENADAIRSQSSSRNRRTAAFPLPASRAAAPPPPSRRSTPAPQTAQAPTAPRHVTPGILIS